MRRKYKVPLLLRVIRALFPLLEKVSPSLSGRLALYFFLAPLKFKPAQKELEMLKIADLFELELNGKKVQCYSWGDVNSPAVLLVHGWAGRTTQFRSIITALMKAGYRVVGFDAPAHGKSEGRKTSLLEFEKAIQKIVSKIPSIETAVTHSFGGIATLLALTKGLKLNTVINFGVPTIPDQIISSFLEIINGSHSTGQYVRNHVMDRTGGTFESHTIMGFVDEIPRDLHLLVVHDEGDMEAPVEHARAMGQAFPAELLITKGLGHNRILRDEGVVNEIVTFIRSHSSSTRVLPIGA